MAAGREAAMKQNGKSPQKGEEGTVKLIPEEGVQHRISVVSQS